MRYNTVFAIYLIETFLVIYMLSEIKKTSPLISGIILTLWFIIGTVVVILKNNEDREEMRKNIIEEYKRTGK